MNGDTVWRSWSKDTWGDVHDRVCDRAGVQEEGGAILRETQRKIDAGLLCFYRGVGERVMHTWETRITLRSAHGHVRGGQRYRSASCKYAEHCLDTLL